MIENIFGMNVNQLQNYGGKPILEYNTPPIFRVEKCKLHFNTFKKTISTDFGHKNCIDLVNREDRANIIYYKLIS